MAAACKRPARAQVEQVAAAGGDSNSLNVRDGVRQPTTTMNAMRLGTSRSKQESGQLVPAAAAKGSLALAEDASGDLSDHSSGARGVGLVIGTEAVREPAQGVYLQTADEAQEQRYTQSERESKRTPMEKAFTMLDDMGL